MYLMTYKALAFGNSNNGKGTSLFITITAKHYLSAPPTLVNTAINSVLGHGLCLSSLQATLEDCILINRCFFYYSGSGQSGPYSKRGGYDLIAAGIGGLMHITGPQVCDSKIFHCHLNFADKITPSNIASLTS